jgi:hypothetical protein
VQSVSLSLVNLGPTAAKLGEHAAARAYLRECLQILEREGDKRLMAYALEAVAELPDLPLEQAARLFGAAEALREAIGSPLPPNLRQEQNRLFTALRIALGAEAFAAAWDAGRALTREQAVAEALTATQPSSETGA